MDGAGLCLYFEQKGIKTGDRNCSDREMRNIGYGIR